MVTGLELTFMGVTWSNSGLFSTPGFVVSPVGKRERWEEKTKKGKREKGNSCLLYTSDAADDWLVV